MNAQERGRYGEDIACEYYTEKGYVLLERNLRAPEGEIDLVLRGEGCIVFVEVKLRASAQRGSPEEAVTPQKQKRICRTALRYLAERDWLQEAMRFDVFAIRMECGVPRCTAYENAFAFCADVGF